MYMQRINHLKFGEFRHNFKALKVKVMNYIRVIDKIIIIYALLFSKKMASNVDLIFKGFLVEILIMLIPILGTYSRILNISVIVLCYYDKMKS